MSKYNRDRRQRRQAPARDGYLTDSATTMAHLRAVLRNRDRWLFVTDHVDGHACLAALALACILRGGEAAGRPCFGSFGFRNLPTLEEITVSWLSVPKAGMDQGRVNAWLELVGMGARVQGDGTDIICLAGGEPRLLYVALEAVRQGKITEGAACRSN